MAVMANMLGQCFGRYPATEWVDGGGGISRASSVEWYEGLWNYVN